MSDSRRNYLEQYWTRITLKSFRESAVCCLFLLDTRWLLPGLIFLYENRVQRCVSRTLELRFSPVYPNLFGRSSPLFQAMDEQTF